jgi:hypothetical protein
MTPWGLVNCKVFGSQEPSLTNRMSELLTYGSVGGVGRKPGPYPALDGGVALLFHISHHWPAASASRLYCFFVWP